MATVIYCDDFSEQLAKGIHNFASHTFKLAFSNTAITTSNAVLADLTQIAYTNISGGVAPTVTVTTSETSGTMTISADAVTITATGSVPTFQYYALYNDSATSDNLVMSWNHGSAVTLANGETFKVSFNSDDTAGTVLTIAKAA
jgi:hypothetical protein